MRLYHYCCACSARHITARGFLLPQPFVFVAGLKLIWLTDQEAPTREGLGLTAHTLRCDRMEHRYLVDVMPMQVMRWLGSAVRRDLAMVMDVRTFEHGRQPHTWWMATRPVFAIRDRAYHERYRKVGDDDGKDTRPGDHESEDDHPA